MSLQLKQRFLYDQRKQYWPVNHKNPKGDYECRALIRRYYGSRRLGWIEATGAAYATNYDYDSPDEDSYYCKFGYRWYRNVKKRIRDDSPSL
jgi:hypothetical protein